MLVNEQKHCHSCVHGRFQHDDVHAMACNFSKEIVWLEEAPTEISAILQKDVMTQYCNENFGSFSVKKNKKMIFFSLEMVRSLLAWV